jgi:ubiquinone/menaquinone biosynthesis C-methylase UbiE
MGDVSIQIARHCIAVAQLTVGSIAHDNACGNGVVTFTIIDSHQPSEITIHATDNNPKMCEVTAVHAASKGWAGFVTTAAMPAEALAYSDNFFSHSFSNFVIHTSPEP